MIAEDDIEKALDYLRSSATEAAQARANVKHLGEFLKAKIAQLAVAAPPGTSAAAADMQAKASPEYAELLEGYKVAVEMDAYHQYKREAAVAAIDVWRTEQSNARAEGRAYG